MLGPLVSTTVAQTVSDGGRNSSNLAGARAAHEESVERYQQTVLVAFREVEDCLPTCAGSARTHRRVESATIELTLSQVDDF